MSTDVVVTIDGAPARLFLPTTAGPHPAIVMGQDGTGFNSMNRRVATALAEDGFVVVAPDYYRGKGPADPESLDDLMDLMQHIAAIDFVREARLFHATVDWLATRDDVDATRIGTWGYCTGGTFALLVASLRRDIGAAVVYYPSQPTMAPVDDTRPVHPIDLLWNIPCPVLLLVGENDFSLGAGPLAEVRRRADVWGVDLTVEVFPGAGHAFCTPVPGWHDEDADRRAWTLASEFVARALRPAAT